MGYENATEILEELTLDSMPRNRLVPLVVEVLKVRHMVEVGVWKGEFADLILRTCKKIQTYYMIDPWRNLVGWNKPLNVSGEQFSREYELALSATEHSRHKRRILRGTTLEVIHQIEDHSLDFAYIDGDHTLRGIMIDLINVYPKVKRRGIIMGDDFALNIWQHGPRYEPTMVFPAAIYFAEAMGDTFIVLPNSQFAIVKTGASESFRLSDPNELIDDVSVLKALGKGFQGGTLREKL